MNDSEMDYFDSIDNSVKKLSTDRLIELVSDPLNQGLEEADAAFLPLLRREPKIAMDLGTKLLATDDGDDYMQATIWNALIKRAPERVVDAMCERKTVIGNCTIGAILVEDEVWEYYKNMSALPQDFIELVINSFDYWRKAWHIPLAAVSDEQLQAGYEEFLRRVGRA